MINSGTSIKVGKSPRKLPIVMSEEVEEEESGSDTESEDFHSMDVEANMKNAGEGFFKDNSCGDEGDDSNTEEEESEDNPSANSISDKTKANPSWADAMRKVLHTKKPKRRKTIVLSKAKKLCDIVVKEKKEPLPFEIEGTDGEIKKEILVKKKSEGEDDADHKKRKRKEIKTGIRVKPSILDRERERTLQKIATKGVVQLFNVVRQQQMEIKKKTEEAGPSESKREKVLKNIDKRAFLDVLMGGTKSIVVDNSKTDIKNEIARTEPEEGRRVWKVLREDFVMGASLKDWDKKTPGEEDDSSTPGEIESDE